MFSIENMSKIGYKIVIYCHSIEKGLSHFILRPFGKNKILSIINLLKISLKYPNYENQFFFIDEINILREYKAIYEKHNWFEKNEYKKTIKFLKNFEYIKK